MMFKEVICWVSGVFGVLGLALMRLHVFALCGLYGYGGLDVGVMLVVKDFEVFVFVLKE